MATLLYIMNNAKKVFSLPIHKDFMVQLNPGDLKTLPYNVLRSNHAELLDRCTHLQDGEKVKSLTYGYYDSAKMNFAELKEMLDAGMTFNEWYASRTTTYTAIQTLNRLEVLDSKQLNDASLEDLQWINAKLGNTVNSSDTRSVLIAAALASMVDWSNHDVSYRTVMTDEEAKLLLDMVDEESDPVDTLEEDPTNEEDTQDETSDEPESDPEEEIVEDEATTVEETETTEEEEEMELLDESVEQAEDELLDVAESTESVEEELLDEEE